jgi:endonuclease V-like protein UPF0215 family
VDLNTLLRRGRRIRTLGIDDGPFERGARRDVLVVGAVYAGAEFEGLLSTRVRQDGHNATDRLVAMIASSKFRPQLHLVMLDGITLGGFNVVDLPALARAIRVPCVAIMRREPDRQAIRRALTHLSRAAARERLMARAGPVHRSGVLCFQAAGVDPQIASLVIRRAAVCGHVPECLRAAHLIARGIVTGESGRRA